MGETGLNTNLGTDYFNKGTLTSSFVAHIFGFHHVPDFENAQNMKYDYSIYISVPSFLKVRCVVLLMTTDYLHGGP